MHNYWSELRSRYWELRQTFLKPEYVIKQFVDFNNGIDKKYFDMDRQLWPSALHRYTDNIASIKEWVTQRFVYSDNLWK